MPQTIDSVAQRYTCSTSDSRSESCVFESRRCHLVFFYVDHPFLLFYVLGRESLEMTHLDLSLIICSNNLSRGRHKKHVFHMTSAECLTWEVWEV